MSTTLTTAGATWTPLTTTFRTPFGWCGLAVEHEFVVAAVVGHGSPQKATAALNQNIQQMQTSWQTALRREGLRKSVAGKSTDSATSFRTVVTDNAADWCCRLQSRVEAYLDGANDNFADVPVISTRIGTPFQRSVRQACREIPFARTQSYGELAIAANAPRAARAVGQVMATNCVPLLIPCHRVIGSQGRLGGFTAPAGISLKQRLLQLESNAWQ